MTDTQEPGGTQRKPRRRWLQVSLRTLLLLVTLLGVSLGWIVNRGERQQRAVKALRRMGVAVSYEDGWAADTKAAYLRGWLPSDYFEVVHAIGGPESPVSDASLVHIQELGRLLTSRFGARISIKPQKTSTAQGSRVRSCADFPD